MNYLTNYYKNLSEQLQERLDYLQRLIESEMPGTPRTDPKDVYPELRTDKEAKELKDKMREDADDADEKDPYPKPDFSPDGYYMVHQTIVDANGRPVGTSQRPAVSPSGVPYRKTPYVVDGRIREALPPGARAEQRRHDEYKKAHPEVDDRTTWQQWYDYNNLMGEPSTGRPVKN